ncbi:MAG: acetylglutamate kinase [Alphaproteobacteria bacterium]|nr:acetylglutamate kinase [Alphaproteobacteria bacterium]
MQLKEKLYVVKIGGETIDSEIDLPVFINQFSAIPSKKILIHGGGKLATNLAAKLHVEQKLVNGRRITNQDTLDLVTMVYAGLINKKLVALLQANNINAIGLTGVDANLVVAKKRQVLDIDYGFVGDVESVNFKFLKDLLQHDLMPVIAPITHNKMGQLLNTNADTISTEIAAALNVFYDTQLIFCFDKKGVLTDMENEDSFLKTIDFVKFQQLQTSQKITKGMLPKLHNAFEAKQKFVKTVCLGKSTNLLAIINHNSGTFIL